MFNKFFAKLLTVSVCGALACSVSAQIVVSKGASGFSRNPSLLFKGISGHVGMSREVDSFVRACGWFDVKSGGSAELSLSGSCDGKYLDLSVVQGNVPLYRLRVPLVSGNLRRAARKGIDAILKRLFKIDGVCYTRIAFCAETGRGIKNIYICDIDGRGVEKITNFPSLCVEPEWFPNAQSIAYTKYNRASTDIVQTRLSPRMSRRLVSYPGLNVGVSVSPNGKYLALILSRDQQVELYVKAVNGGAKRRLTRGSAVEASPCWSPDGGSICFVSDRAGAPQLYIIGANGGAARRLRTVGSEAATPGWSRDNQIAYSARMGSHYTIALLDLNGVKPGGVIVRAAGDWESPSWAPDNRHIVCSRTFGGSSALYIVDTWTGKVRKLLNARNSLSMPAWSN